MAGLTEQETEEMIQAYFVGVREIYIRGDKAFLTFPDTASAEASLQVPSHVTCFSEA